VSFARRTAGFALGAALFTALVAICALSFQQPLDGFSGSKAVSAIGKISCKNFRLQHAARSEPALAKWLEGELASLNPSFLWVDYKQNLLVWPVIAASLIRSPPFGIPL
jgi:hypothetical protein